jgi:hypothetical protein
LYTKLRSSRVKRGGRVFCLLRNLLGMTSFAKENLTSEEAERKGARRGSLAIIMTDKYF